MRTVQLWLQDGMPSRLINGSRKVVRADANAWLRAKAAEDAKGDKSKKPSTLQQVELRLEEAKAAKAEIELARLRGELVTVEEAVAAHESRLTRLRAALLTMPQKWAPLLVGCKSMPEATDRLDRAVREAMQALAEGA